MVPLEPGRTLSHYRIVGKLGQGGQAAAYRADDLRLNRPVVIKALRPELAESEPARRRFEREACLCSVLEHPNICAIFDMGEEEGLAYIVMQLVEGRTLKELLNGRPLATLSALSIAIQIADALAVAHANGIVHRDIKPTNVMVTPSGQAKVLDFGLAKMLASDAASETKAVSAEGGDPMTEVGVPYGSIGYGSPEQAAGENVDHRSDIFSLGVVLYEMFTGQPAFRGKNRLELLRGVINETPRPIALLNPDAPPQVQAIVERALAKDPAERFQTMAALRDDLKALLRRLSRPAGALPSEPAAPLLAPQRAKSSWILGGSLVRALGRWRGTPGAQRAVPEPGQNVVIRPASWGSETKTTLAVLPFRNLSSDASLAFYEFSLADGIITELGQLRSLVVRPSSYIAQYAGRDPDPRQAGEELAASLVLTGSFAKAGDRFRVNAQLLTAASCEILWSERIDVAASDLLAIQDTISERVIAGLKLTLSAEEQERLERLPTKSGEAWEFYLRGRDALFRYITKSFDDADLEGAIQMFNEAIGKDAAFAAAHAALGRAYVHHAQGYGGPEYYTLAERALRRALALDERLAEARLQLVYVDLNHGDKPRARATISALRRETPDEPAVLFVSAMLHRIDGLYEQALEEYGRLLGLSRQDEVPVRYNRARIFTYLRQYDRAAEELERARALEPEHPLVKTFLAIVYFNQGRIDEAQSLVEDVLRQSPHFDGLQPVLGWCLSAKGEHERARALISERVKETAGADHDIALWLASLYAMEGMLDEGVLWARRAVALGNENYPLFAGSHKLDSLRGDPRFTALLDELKASWEARRREGMTEDAGARPA
jgi:serine/threonine-protein kinase